MILAHRIALDPTVKQREYFVRAAGTARFVWNVALEEWGRSHRAGEKPNAAKLKKLFNKSKYHALPWLKDVHRDSHAQPFADLQVAFNRFFAKKAKRPKFKKKGRHDSFYVANDKLRLDDNHVRLPVLGWVRMREVLRFDGKIMGARVTRDADRWFISIQVDVPEARKERAKNDIAGVDLGVRTVATISTSLGETRETGPKPLSKAIRRIKRVQRSVSRRTRGSHRRMKAVRGLARIHVRVANIRRDFLHKLTTRLCRENQAVVIEDLNVKGMLRDHHLARALSDVGMSEFRRQLEYKARMYGTEIILADRWYPSTKSFSGCGAVKDFIARGEQVFRCDQCGLVLDRDVNAARNLRTLGLRGINARGHDIGDGIGTDVSVATSVDEARTKRCAHESAQIR